MQVGRPGVKPFVLNVQPRSQQSRTALLLVTFHPTADLARVQALAEYVTGADYPAWTLDPDNAAE